MVPSLWRGSAGLAWAGSWLIAVGCASPTHLGQGGAQFRQVTATSPLPAEALAAVCWPPDAPAAQSVVLDFRPGGEISFETRGGASNSTARCAREIAATYPWVSRPTGALEWHRASTNPTGWAVLAWIGLLSPGRYGPERGVTAPIGLVRACLSLPGGLAPGTRFEVAHLPVYTVRVIPEPVTDSERCIEAVLGATVWPSTRAFSLAFEGPAPVPSEGDVSAYRASEESVAAAMPPTAVKEGMVLRQGAVAACWDAALARRAGLGGARTVRFRVRDGGEVGAAWVAGTVSDQPTAADYLLDACLIAAVKGARFLAPGEGVYTWVFASRG